MCNVLQSMCPRPIQLCPPCLIMNHLINSFEVNYAICSQEQQPSREQKQHKQMHMLGCNNPTEPFQGLSPCLYHAGEG